jgi:tetratricopeptide repeat protein 30
MNIEDDPSGGFRKLNYLLQNPPFPNETFPNLLLLYCKYQYFDLAADVLAENTDLTFKCINPDDFEYVDSLI